MAKDGDFIMRPCQGWVIGLYNNTPGVNNVTQSIKFPRRRRARARWQSGLMTGIRHRDMVRRMRFNSSNVSINRRNPVGATDFLRRDDKLAAMMPAIERMAALQKDCAVALPAMFKYCEILAFDDGQLTLSLPNASLAAKLKQQIPKLQETLARRGWQVNGVKLRVQMSKPAEIKEQMRALSLPEAAVTAFDQLGETLEDTPQNATLIAALKAMVARRRPA